MNRCNTPTSPGDFCQIFGRQAIQIIFRELWWRMNACRKYIKPLSNYFTSVQSLFQSPTKAGLPSAYQNTLHRLEHLCLSVISCFEVQYLWLSSCRAPFKEQIPVILTTTSNKSLIPLQTIFMASAWATSDITANAQGSNCDQLSILSFLKQFYSHTVECFLWLTKFFSNFQSKQGARTEILSRCVKQHKIWGYWSQSTR